MDWMNKEWAEDSLDTDYPGFQDPVRGNEPSIDFKDTPMKCRHCGIELENQAEWLVHQMYAHHENPPKPAAPVVDLDAQLPAGYNEVSRPGGEPGITTGKVSERVNKDNWFDTYSGDDAIRIPFLADWQNDKSPILPVKWIGNPGGMHSDVYGTNVNPDFSRDSGEVVFTTFGPPQIHLIGRSLTVTHAEPTDPRYSTLMNLAKRKMIDFKHNPDNTAHNYYNNPRPEGWANAFRLSAVGREAGSYTDWASGSQRDNPNAKWMDTYIGEDAIRVPFYMDKNFQVKWMGTPGDWHATSVLEEEEWISGEVVYSNFGPPQIHYTFGKGDVLPNDDPRATPILMKARKKMIDFRNQIKRGETPELDTRTDYDNYTGDLVVDGYGSEWAKMVHQPGWVDSFRFSNDWNNPSVPNDGNIEGGERVWADNYTGDDAIRVPFYEQDGKIRWVGNPGDHHGTDDASNRLFADGAYGGEVIFSNFGSPVVHFGDGDRLPHTHPRATEPYMKARQKMMEWRKQVSTGQTHQPARWNTVPGYDDWDAKVQRPGWVQQFKLTAEAPIAGPIPWLYDEKGDKLYVGHPGDGPQDIQAPDYNTFGVVEGYYFPDGELRIMETSNIPITIRHLIKLWYYMHPELEVKKVMLEFTDLGGVKKRQKLAAEDVAAKVHQLLVADPAAHTAALALGHHGNVYVVGGAIRDLALGREPKDIDLMVQGIDADTIEKILKQLPGRVDFTGKAFGVFRYRTKEGFDVEIAMPRTEASTGAGHKDFEVKTDPTLPIETDLSRRDFTGNAMAFDLKRGELIDPYGGWDDLQQRKLRTTSEFSFPDDPLRIMRGLASRSRHGLIPDEETKAAMRKNAPNLKHLPAERIQAELDKLMGGDHPADAIRLAQETGVLEHFLPELSRTHQFDQQNKYHNQELFDHTMTVLDHVAKNSDDKDLRYMAMLHDIGKPDAKWIDDEGWAHYYQNEHGQGLDHEHHGADLTREALQRLKFPRARTERVEHLVRHHMFPEFKSEAGARKFINRVGPDHADDLMLMREGDLKGKPAQNDVGNMRNLIQSVRAKADPTGAANLAINGKDLIALGVPPGPGMGGILKHLLDMVLENPALNQRETLLQMAREYNAAV
jgi:tRNA nucleotidyltransferase/poly(A) polymerase